MRERERVGHGAAVSMYTLTKLECVWCGWWMLSQCRYVSESCLLFEKHVSAQVRTGDLLCVRQTWWPLHHGNDRCHTLSHQLAQLHKTSTTTSPRLGEHILTCISTKSWRSRTLTHTNKIHQQTQLPATQLNNHLTVQSHWQTTTHTTTHSPINLSTDTFTNTTSRHTASVTTIQ